jgi:Uma2 family endonuclease
MTLISIPWTTGDPAMATLVLDDYVEERLRAERKASGADRYDEVWEGVYHMPPMAGDEHQEIVSQLTTIFTMTINWPGLGQVRAGVNVSDREEDWTFNYRVPDVAVFLAGTSARNCGTHWLGGPDFAVEVASRGDDTRAKLPFYAKVGVRELLLIDRNPWVLELYRNRGGELVLVGVSRAETGDVIASEVVPMTFRLIAGEDEGRPRIEVRRALGEESWLI